MEMEKQRATTAMSVAPTRELAGVPTPMLARKLHAFFADTACAVFHEFEEPNTPPTEHAVQQRLTIPLQWMLCAGDPALTFAGLEQQKTQSNFCGKVFKSGEPAYFCKDCQTDPTCCLCMDCFEHSEHKNHRYRLFASGGGGCCDCGDPEAWTSEVYCQKHKPTQEKDNEADPVESLPSDTVDRARVFFYTILWYCIDVLSWEEGQSVPPYLHIGRTSESLAEDKFLAFLYNDEIHSYDEVITTLTHNIKLQHSDAVALATYVDRKGRAVTKVGSEEDCLRCNELVNTGIDTPLTAHAYHTALVAHQHNSLYCLNLLKELAEKSPAFCRLISQALLQVNRQKDNPCCVLDKVFLIDSKLWIAARITWHRLILGSVYLDSVYKKDLAVTLAANYCQLQKNFVADSHHHDVCASNMTVQLFTVPSLSRMLVLEHGLLRIIVSTLLDILTPCKDPITGVLKLRSSNYKHSRVFYIMYDLRYVLRNKPEVWSEKLRAQVLEAFEYLLDLLGLIQNSDPVKRQRGVHVEREEPWEHSFNFSIVLQPAILLFIEWCCLDRKVLQRAVIATMKKHDEVSQRDKLVYKHHTCEASLVGKRSMELIVFDILKDHVSIHQPLPRVIASLLAGADAHGMTIPQLLQYQANDCQGRLFLMEHCSRSIVMSSQVMAGMWKRNGYSVVNQIINYQFHYSKEIMYDRDILMLQCMASILDPNTFLYALIYKFRLEKWLASPLEAVGKRGEQRDDQLKFLICELEEFLFLLIVIFSERYIPGIGRGVSNTDALKREIIHRLYLAPQTHSELVKQFRLKENENEIDKLLKEVAVLRRTGVGGKSVFELKPEYEKECSPFFYHYTRMDHSKAAEARRKRLKEVGGVRKLPSSPPERPPSFTTPFEGISRLTCSPVLHRVIQCVLKQSSLTSETRVWSDKLLHEILFLCGLMFLEEEPTEPSSLCNAAIGQFGDNAFMTELEQLLTSSHAKEHFPLLSWIVNYLRTAREHGPGTPTKIEPSGSQPTGSATAAARVEEVDHHPMDQSTFDLVSQKKKQMAMEQREKLMAQISSMQKRFLETHQQELEQVDISGSKEGVSDQVTVSAPPPRCAVGVVSLLDHAPSPRSLTCILCQEESKDTNSQEKPFVQAVFVQRSAVLRRGSYDEEEVEFLSARADLPSGTYTGGCGHHMHAECWRSFLENKQQEHRRSFFFPIPGQSVQWQSGEFLCPLCQCYGNTVLPLMMNIRQCSTPNSSPGSVEFFRPTREIKMDEWKELVDLAVDMAASGELMDTGSSVDPTLLEKLEELLPGYRKPITFYTSSPSEADIQLTSVQALFSQAVFMRAYGADPDETSDKVSLALWDNCAYTIGSLERNARYQDTFLLQPDSLSSRQLDNVRSLVRLGCEPKLRPSLSSLVKYTQQLMNSFLHTSPPFSELPCILEVDTFHMLVNLHFTLSSLFATVSCPHGPRGPSRGNPVLPALIGITDQHLVRITAAAHILQYLITCPPCPAAMEVDAPSKSGSGTEFGTGVGLQELWIKYRRLARLPVEGPPSPYDLVAGVQEHLYAFLESSALFFYCLSGIDFVYSSSASGLATRFEDLCQYIGVPSAVHTLFTANTSLPHSLSITQLANHWCSHPRLSEIVKSNTTPLILQIPRQLVELPERYSDLVKRASTFQCPKRTGDREYSDDGQAAMLCLVCGEMLCTNSYCCQKVVEVDGVEQSEEDKLRIGGFTQHAQSCGAGLGMALWILESYVVLLDVTDVHNVKGCTVTPPYLDEYGESDPGLRRGNPLKLNLQTYKELRLLWFHHKIPERISTEMEGNRGLLRINWSKM